MQKEHYNNYYRTNTAYLNLNKDNYLFDYYKKNLNYILDNYDKQSRILDIGCGKGSFARYLQLKKFTNYVGLDLDQDQIKENINLINGYEFYYQDGMTFLQNSKEKFDIIFMSHVTEHFNKNEISILIEKIFANLSGDGVFINIMPNGGGLFFSNIGRYADCTHEILYTENSFNQILLENGFSIENIQHKNTKPNSFFVEIIRKTLKLFIKIFILFLGYPYPKVDTFEIITIAKKH